ncbi:MAG: S41 family peptidase [Bacteroidota bacterium]
MKTLFLTLTFGIILSACMSQEPKGQKFAEKRTTPFSAVKWTDAKPQIKVESQWYQIVSMGPFSGETLLDTCKSIYPNNWKKRFGEDFVEFLWKLNLKPKVIESFELKDADEQVVTMELEFSRAKRNEVYKFYRANYDKEFEMDFRRKLEKSAMIEDLEYLKTQILNHYAYADLKGVDTEKEISQLAQTLEGDLSLREFGIRIQQLMLKYGDGHSRVRKLELSTFGSLPFSTHDFEGKVICHKDESLFHKDFPFLYSINGVKAPELLKLSLEYIVQDGSEQFKGHYAAKSLKNIGFLLSRVNKYNKDLDVVLMDEAGNTFQTRSQLIFAPQLSAKFLEEFMNPIKYKSLEGNIGYLKISQMTAEEPEKAIVHMMELAKDTRALIIDVRGNGGGSRTIGNALIPYFIGEDQHPLIASLAKLRTDTDYTPPEGLLDNRFMYPLNSPKFSVNERESLQKFMQNFQAEWEYENEKYSDWHYYVLRKDENKSFYAKPVIVLMDAGCFSATDIFLGALNQVKQVTLMGTKSGGGSGRSQSYQLPNSAFQVKLSSMISFQPEGYLYDGRGVEPDIYVKQTKISDILGETDSQLEYAINYLQDLE